VHYPAGVSMLADGQRLTETPEGSSLIYHSQNGGILRISVRPKYADVPNS
jgi:hypothetical protein